MARGLLVVAIAILLLPLASAWHQGHRHWSTIPDGPYTYSPPQPQTFLASDGTEISYAVFMPNVPAGTRVPVIVSAGPYFGLSEEPVNVPSSSRFTGFLIDNFVSHGYAVVPVSIRGTGLSGGCMELMSLREAMDLDELVTFVANEPWSDGNVGMAGKSYDGGTPWMVAQLGNPHLKTIVPLQGVTDPGDLMFHRGAAQQRGPIFHSAVYWPFGLGMDPLALHDPMYRPLDKRVGNLACPEMVEGQAVGVYSAYTGDTQNAPVLTDYWQERAWRQRTIENYDGSVFIVHGLQDWNVIPSQVAPFFNELPGAKKAMFGQWSHQYPDEGVFTQRDDFAQVLKNWFDRELKGISVDVGPVAEVADSNGGTWRAYSQWPPAPASVHTWQLTAGNALTTGAPAAFSVPFASPAGTTVGGLAAPCNAGNGRTEFATTTTTSMRLSGIGSLTVLLDPPTPGTLTASVCAGNTLIAHGGANTLYAHSNEIEAWDVGGPTDIRIDLEPAERTIPAGTRLSVALRFEGGSEAGQAYWPATSPGVGVLVGGTLSLPSAT